jgi:hypothetical protein
MTDSGGSVDFEPGLEGTIALTTGTLTITKDLTISGSGSAVITVSGSQASTVFSIDPTVHAAIAGLTVADGHGAFGGGIHNSGALTLTDSVIRDNTAAASSGASGGGGIWNDGTLTVTDSILSDNTVNAVDIRNPSAGGGIANRGTLTLIRSTVSGNVAVGSNATLGQGAGIWNAGTLTATDTIVSDNATTRFGGSGGGIWNAGTLTVIGSTLRANVAHGFNADGGGIWNAGTLTITGSTLSGNDGSERGGGIENDASGTLTLIASVVSENVAGVYGGGISNDTGCVLTIRNSTLSTNSANMGGGIANRDDGMLTMIDSTLSHNTAFNGGGGIWNIGGTGTITRSTLSGNVAFRGAGIWNVGELTITNSTLSGNVARGGGAGIANLLTLTVTSSTLSGNVANSGAGVAATNTNARTFALDTIIAGNVADSSPDVQGRLDSQGHNLIGDGSGGTGFTDTDLVGTPEQPIDPQLEPLGNYGGPTQTMRPFLNSPAVDAGDNRVLFSTDQRGLPRIVNLVIDIGAVELQPDERRRGPRGAPLQIAGEFPAWEQQADSWFSALGTDALATWFDLHSRGVASTDAAPAQAVANHDLAGHRHMSTFCSLQDARRARSIDTGGLHLNVEVVDLVLAAQIPV